MLGHLGGAAAKWVGQSSPGILIISPGSRRQASDRKRFDDGGAYADGGLARNPVLGGI
jgi:hypothetical protein